MANEAESRRWNDPGWAASWPQRERLTDSVSPYLLKVVDPCRAQRICDIGSGGGALALVLADAVGPEGEVVGFDISAPLVQLASDRAREAGVTNTRFVQMDVQTEPSGEEPFDQAVSQFGVMFFDEPLAAFRNIRGMLHRGGRLVFACWQGVEHNPWHVATALRRLIPPPRTPPPGKSPVSPFALGDDEYVREILEAAGYGDVHGSPQAISIRAPASAVVDVTLLELMGVSPERLDEAARTVERHLERFAVGPDEFEYPLAFTVYEASNP
jgi:SAM-dependent methyltransferase